VPGILVFSFPAFIWIENISVSVGVRAHSTHPAWAWHYQWFPSSFPNICSSQFLGFPAGTDHRPFQHLGSDIEGSSTPLIVLYHSGYQRGGESLVASCHSLSACRFGSVPVMVESH
jgi:hypothetical protein